MVTQEKKGLVELSLLLLPWTLWSLGPIGILSVLVYWSLLVKTKGTLSCTLEHNVEGEVNITGKLSLNEKAPRMNMKQMMTLYMRAFHMRDVLQLTLHAVVDFHCSIDCDHLQDRLEFD